jgi:hypothetical protein
MGGETNKATGRDTRSVVDQCFLSFAFSSASISSQEKICAGRVQSRRCCCRFDDDHRVRASS